MAKTEIQLREVNTTATVAAPSGVVLPFAGSSGPDGWLICDGREVSRTTYADLFSAIGTNFGEGDGSTTFHLPDMRGRFPRGTDDMGTAEGPASRDPDAGSRTASNTNGNTGNSVGSVQDDEMVGHNHATGVDSVTSGSPSVSDGGGYIKGDSSVPGAFGRIASPNAGFEVATRDNPSGNETRPKNVNLNYIIKY